MSITLESFGIDRLSVPDRLELIDRIWESLPESLDPSELTGPLLEELERRR